MRQPQSARRATIGAGAVCALLLVAGCATDGSSGLANLGTPFKGPSESGFFALIRQNCASYSIGGEPLASLSQGAGGIATLTTELYRGNLSNDEYLNRLLLEHPAADANVPAAGCVIDQLDSCLSSDCQLQPSRSPELIAAEEAVTAEQQAALSRTPDADRAAVETMADAADEAVAAEGAELGDAP